MAKLLITPVARDDLMEIKGYISTNLHNPSAARDTVKGITTQMRALEQFPEIGTLVFLEAGATAYRYLIYKSYMTFYHIQGDCVIVDRVLYGRRDYLQLLLGRELEEDETE